MMNTKAIGDKGETIAVNYLTNAGYVILERNYRCKQGEIDIIAQKCDVLVFIEVKTRRTLRYGTPGAAVDYKKQQRIIRSAAWYIRCRDVNMHCRFDVVEVLSMPSGSAKINHIVNAFEVK